MNQWVFADSDLESDYIFQIRLLYLCLFLVYAPIFVSVSCLSTSVSLYLFVNPVWFLSLCQSKFTAISFNPVFFISVYSLYMHLYLFLSLVYLPLFLYTSLSIQIHTYLFLSFYQSTSKAISFNLVIFISVYSLYVQLYLFLSLVYPPLFLYISLSIQIDAYLFQPHFLYLSLIFLYPPVSIFICFLSTIISFYLLFIKIYIYLFQSPSPDLSLSLVYWPISFSIFWPIQIHGYIFQCWSLYLNISLIYLPLSLSFSFISLYQSRFTLISFNLSQLSHVPP